MKKLNSTIALLVGLVGTIVPAQLTGQNYDPPGRVARIRYMQSSVSFEPAGESVASASTAGPAAAKTA